MRTPFLIDPEELVSVPVLTGDRFGDGRERPVYLPLILEAIRQHPDDEQPPL